MKKGYLLKATGILLISLFLIVGFSPATKAATIKLSYAFFAPARSFPGVQMMRWAKEVEKRTNGKVKVNTYPGGTLLGAKNMLDGVVSGVADIGCFCPPYMPGRFPLMEAVDLPVGFKSSKVASAVTAALYKKYKPASFSKVKVLTMFCCAPGNIMSKVPIKSLKDLKKIEIRGTGISGKYLGAIGATPVAMPMSSVPESLQKGVVKGLISSLEVMKDFNFASLCQHVTILNGPTTSFAVVMNKKKWDSLPADVKKVLEDLYDEQCAWTGKYEDDHVKEALAWSKKKYNVKVYKLTDAEYKEIDKKVHFMVENYLKKTAKAGLPGKKFLDDLMALKAKYEKKYGK
jgi:TRAP-type C4-dicarboxylate transport system substrate-binding protein